ncbi:chemotaxis response regulator protein-glutamate methylesterase [Gallaecimonas kandeliae]|uniref:protein-glutamate methylesterase/protein-glutamine glutaminase n=1 Tax=Gallaecimonas kandeliae TaxID=3029055 RepID=UPI00264A4C0C|nr:chemotaxis response regulator protein-glutamate methylesterase [Gallaecimonas kandeliae]WKE67060.1 chemotaxis response regulator protein-glutamate methylesterase [Gallaecimonas kandeliae]
MTRVLVVDDSPLMRALISDLLARDPELEVVGSAADPYEARDAIKALKPDVLTLDIEMPKMNGLAFLKNLMRLHPLPVVMVSTLTQHGAEVTLQALELGAVDYVPKPASATGALAAYGELLREKVKVAASARLQQPGAPKAPRVQGVNVGRLEAILIGASTGGTEAVKRLLCQWPATMPPILVVQHIRPFFSSAFTRTLDSLTPLKVQELEKEQPLLPGEVWVAPGDRHMRLVRRAGRLYAQAFDGEPVGRHRPAVDVLFESAAQAGAGEMLALLLTGMGRDGAAGMKALAEGGATTWVQDEESAVVWGMPRVAWENGAAQRKLGLDALAMETMKLLAS